MLSTTLEVCVQVEVVFTGRRSFVVPGPDGSLRQCSCSTTLTKLRRRNLDFMHVEVEVTIQYLELMRVDVKWRSQHDDSFDAAL